MGCPDEAVLLDFATGTLRGDAQAAIEGHIDGCSQCFEVIASLGVQDEVADGDDERAGRYVLGPVLGAGAMGTVYAARDPVLDRTVAVKVLRSDRAITEQRRLRLLREAQSLARIRHPNVVSVYDAGETGGNVYVAMELVVGSTLAEYLEHAEPSWRDVVRLFVAAGRGLAAAHAVGIVHRDFKPANVLIDGASRAVVTDFGLAATDAEFEAPLAAEPPALLAHALSASRARVGTPAYMAPEQFEGRRATVRSDQFAFCVALVEALVGQRPFRRTAADGADRNELKAEVLSRVPGPSRLARVLERGLAANPDHRHGSMDDLLAALGRCLTLRRKRIFGAGLAAVLASAGGVAWMESRPPDACSDPMASVWTERRAAAVRSVLQAPTGSRASASSQRGLERIESHVAELDSAFAAVCSAMPRRVEQASPELRSQWSCVNARRARFDALTAEFERAEPGPVSNLLGAVARLVPLSTCLDPELAVRAAPQPEDPALGAAVQDIRIELELVRVSQEAAGRDAHDDLVRLVERGHALDFDPLSAELQLHMGAAVMLTHDYGVAAEHFERSYAAGARSGHERVAAAAIRALMQALQLQGKFDDARTWAKAAAPLQRSDWERVELSLGLGHLATTAGDFDEARGHFEDAFAWRESCGQCDGAPVSLDSMLASYFADYLTAVEDWPEARKQYARSLELDRERLGPGHIVVADALVALAGVDRNVERLDLAEAELREAIAIAAEIGTSIPVGWATLGELQVDRGEFDLALASFQEAHVAGAGPLFDAVVDVSRASVLARLGRHDEARPLCAAAAVRLTRDLGGEHPRVAAAEATCKSLDEELVDEG